MPKRRIEYTKEEFQSFREKAEKAILDNDNEFAHQNSLEYVYSQIYDRAIHADISDVILEEVSKKYAKALLSLSYSLKKGLEPDYDRAVKLLNKVLQILDHRNVPLANYRLAHIAFRREEYSKAISYFEQALNTTEPVLFGLEPFQINNAKKVKAFCALKILEESDIDPDENEWYPELNETINKYLNVDNMSEKPIVHKIWKNGKIESVIELSMREYVHLLNEIEKDDTRAYFDLFDPQPNIHFHGAGYLTDHQREFFKLLLGMDEDGLGFTNGNTLNQNIRRLREALRYTRGLAEKLSIENPPGRDPYINTDLQIDIFDRAIL